MPALLDFFLPEYNKRHDRFVFLDVARAAIIIYIVLIVHGLFFTEIWPGGLKSLLLFEMPLIFVVGGYSHFLFEKAHYNSRFQARHFTGLLCNKAVRILLPYLAYAIACIALTIAFCEHCGQAYSTSKLVSQWLNPFSFRAEVSIGRLEDHIWFVPVFFLVSLILPFAARIRLHPRMSIAHVWLISLVVIYLNSRWNIHDSMLTYIVFYFTWAYLGYQIARGTPAGYLDFIIVFAISVSGLALVGFHDKHLLYMQANKFPPNVIFFLFSSVWVSLILLVISRFKLPEHDYAKTAKYLKPVILRGYSIYLWQGIPYTIAGFLVINGPAGKLIAIAICFMASIVLGIIFGPLEQIKYKSIENFIRNALTRRSGVT